MNHIKLYEEFSQEEFDSMMGDMKSLGFEGYSLYFVQVKGWEHTRGYDEDDDLEEWDDDNIVYHDFCLAIVFKKSEEVTSLLYEYVYEEMEIGPNEYMDEYIEDHEYNDDFEKSLVGLVIAEEGGSSDLTYECELKIAKVIGPYDTNATEPMIEKYPFKPGSKMAKYAAPYMNLPEVKALLSSVSK